MIPVGPIIAAAIAARRSGGGAQQTTPEGANATVRFFVFVFACVPLIVVALADRPAVACPILALLAVPMLPSLVLERVLVPLRLPRAAYYFALCSPPVRYSREIRGGAVFFGALAALRSPKEDPGTVRWLEDRLQRARTVREVTVTAAGLLAALRGKLDAARLLLGAVDASTHSKPPRAVRAAARSWLVADAARSGDWPRVAELGRRPYSYLRWPHAMSVCAERLLRLPTALGDGWLWLYWALAPGRRATLPVLRRALATPFGEPLPALDPDEFEDEGEDAPLATALRRHARCLASPRDARLADAAVAWDAVRGAPYVKALLERRAMGLGATQAADAALGRLIDTAETDLAVHAKEMTSSSPSPSVTLEGAIARARRHDLDEIEAMAAALRDRANRRAAIHPIEEWAAWASLRERCERVSRRGGPVTRRAVFGVVYGPACNWAVWLFNERLEKLLAHQVFRWLLFEAQLTEDARAFDLLERNVRSGSGA